MSLKSLKQQELSAEKKVVEDQYQHAQLKILKRQRPLFKAKKIGREPIYPNEKSRISLGLADHL